MTQAMQSTDSERFFNMLSGSPDDNEIRKLKKFDEKDKSKNITDFEWEIFLMLTEKSNKGCRRELAKIKYCYSGPQAQKSLLTDEEEKEFEQAREACDLLKIDKVYLVGIYSPEIRQQYSYQELYGRALESLLYGALPVPAGVARIACDYSPCMIPDFFEAEDWAREGFTVPPSRSIVQSGDEDGAEDYDDGEIGDGGARSYGEAESYEEDGDEKADC